MKANIIKDNHAQVSMVSFFIGAMIAVIIALQVAWPVMDTSINSKSSAHGTITWSGNATQGNYVNFTYNSGRYDFCFSVADVRCSTPSINVTMVANVNSSQNASEALASTINANTTLAGVLTATNSSAGVVTITYDTTGTPGNQIGTTTNATNATWSSSTLSGGAYGLSNMSSASKTLVDQLPLFLVLVVLMVFVKALI